MQALPEHTFPTINPHHMPATAAAAYVAASIAEAPHRGCVAGLFLLCQGSDQASVPGHPVLKVAEKSLFGLTSCGFIFDTKYARLRLTVPVTDAYRPQLERVAQSFSLQQKM